MPDFQQFAFAGFIIIGLINGIQFAFDRNWKSFVFFLVAVIGGGVFGALGLFGLPSVEMGLGVGIFSSGVYKTAQKLGGE